MLLLRWIVGLFFFALFIHLSVLNAFVFWSVHVRKQSTASWIPLLGGVFGTISLAVLPLPEFKHFWWLPLLLDYGCLPGLTQTVFFHSTRVFKERSRPTEK